MNFAKFGPLKGLFDHENGNFLKLHSQFKKLQHNFPKMRGGGIKGRLELFRKFIRFGEGRHPLFSDAPISIVV